jgi:hypothetical protein
MVKKVNNEKTGLAVPKTPKSPLSRADRAALDNKRVTENIPYGHKKAPLRAEERPDGPQGQKVDTQEEHYAKTRGHWDAPAALGEFQPRSGDGKFMTIQELPVMPDEYPLSAGGPHGVEKPITPTTSKTVAAVSKGQWDYDTAKPLD